MIPLLDANRAMSDAQSAFTEMRHYKGNEQYKRTVEWIESLIVQHQVSLNDCGKEKLADVQVRIKQLIAMRSAMVDPGGAFTGFVFG
jgi:hypothetical protein